MSSESATLKKRPSLVSFASFRIDENQDAVLLPTKSKRNWSSPFTPQPVVSYNRVFDRGGEFYQSNGHISIKKRILRQKWRALYGLDWFHSLINAPTSRIVLILMGGYLFMILVFAFFFYVISKTMGCDMDIDNFLEAFAFSLETMATIGYGTRNIFFGDCLSPIFILTLQVCVKLILDAVTIGVIYCRISRPTSRASTIIFSNKAIIRRIRGKLYFMFQICELRKHQLLEAHIRLYVLRSEVDMEYMSKKEAELTLSRNPGPNGSIAVEDLENGKNETTPLLNRSSTPGPKTYIQTCSMRLNHPNDELGGMLLMMMPQVVVHEIDAGSPLMAPPLWYRQFSGIPVRWNPPCYQPMVRPGPPPAQPQHPQHNNNYQNNHSNNNNHNNNNKNYNSNNYTYNTVTHQSHSHQQSPQRGKNGQPPKHPHTLRNRQQTNNPPQNPLNLDSTLRLQLPPTFPSKPSYRYSLEAPDDPAQSDSSAEHIPLDHSPAYDVETLSQLAFPGVSKRYSDSNLTRLGENLDQAYEAPHTPTPEAPSPLVRGQGLTFKGLSETVSGGSSSSSESGVIDLSNFIDGDLSEESDLSDADVSHLPKHTTGTEESSLRKRKNKTVHFTEPTSTPDGTQNPNFKHTKPNDAKPKNLSPPPPTRSSLKPPAGPFSPGLQRFEQKFNFPQVPLGGDTPPGSPLRPGSAVRSEVDWQREEKHMVSEYMKDRQIEIVAIVEGTDAATGGCVQARHSYVVDEIEWDQTFESCMTKDPEDGCTTIDFSLFHELVPVSEDAAYAGPISSFL